MRRMLIVVLSMLLFSLVSAGATSCDVDADNCRITITLNIAFQGASQDYMYGAKSEIENFWNTQPPQTGGDCKCEVKFVVNTQTAQNCDQPPQDYHCIKVTDYDADPPRATNGSKYIGYMYPPGVSGGQPLKGWWSNKMSRPVEGGQPGEHYFDFAHEAGHMMGLEDGDGGIMGVTSGPNAKVTQDLIDEVLRDVCKDKKCPDRCCCGNGQVEKGKGEGCDPVAVPTGCGTSDYCCPYCCNCYGKQCDPEAGEYPTKEECEQNCKPTESGASVSCAYSYWTGCWNCMETWMIQLYPEFDPTKIREAGKDNHTIAEERVSAAAPKGLIVADTSEEIATYFTDAPMLSSFFGDERVNFRIINADTHYFIFKGGEVVQSGEGPTPDPTLTVFTDEDTLYSINYGEVHPLVALKAGRITFQGEGLFGGIKFWLADIFFSNLVFVEGPGAEEVQESVLIAE